MMPVRSIEYAGEGGVRLEVGCDGETVWLTQEQICRLFRRERSVITKHVCNVFREGELDERGNVQNLHIANSDKPVKFYSLDVIISVGYRVKSVEGTRFRQWATRKLRDILLSRVVDARRIDKLENRVENVEHGLAVLADEFNGWTILPVRKPMGFGVKGKGE